MNEQLRIFHRPKRSTTMAAARMGAAFEKAASAGVAYDFPGLTLKDPESARRTLLTGGLATLVHVGAVALLVILASLAPAIEEVIIPLQILKDEPPPPKKAGARSGAQGAGRAPVARLRAGRAGHAAPDREPAGGGRGRSRRERGGPADGRRELGGGPEADQSRRDRGRARLGGELDRRRSRLGGRRRQRRRARGAGPGPRGPARSAPRPARAR